MGVADIIPGVSGGTIAFITGIYDQLVDAVRSFDLEFAARLARLDLAGALARVHARFLAPLVAGIAVALLCMARLMSYLLERHPIPVWAFFFGLIAASVLVVGRRVGAWGPVNALLLLFGAVGSFLLVGLVPVSTPEAFWFVFLSGALAICAMILPGISGAFVLLLIGKYGFITKALKNPLALDNLLILAVFGCGAVAGLACFSRLLHYLLKKWHGPTISLLTGFMLGALRKVWPWKQVLETKLVGLRTVVLREQASFPSDLDCGFYLALGLMLVAAAAVLVLDRLSAGRGGV
ncbi:MAG: DUF368 domain-containing protein [Desulfovibrionaceae bacterium]|nr:DUF368 domain-containing protein [Desulfovibrionaceae bacterium]